MNTTRQAFDRLFDRHRTLASSRTTWFGGRWRLHARQRGAGHRPRAEWRFGREPVPEVWKAGTIMFIKAL